MRGEVVRWLGVKLPCCLGFDLFAALGGLAAGLPRRLAPPSNDGGAVLFASDCAAFQMCIRLALLLTVSGSRHKPGPSHPPARPWLASPGRAALRRPLVFWARHPVWTGRIRCSLGSR